MTGSTAANGYFDSAYRDYEAQNPRRKLDHYLDHIDSRVPDGPVSLLDVGCGLGAFLAAAHDRHPELTLAATDLDQEAVDTTTRRLPSADVRLASATDAPFDENRFNVVTAWDVIEHVPDRDRALHSIIRMVKPGGLVVMVVPVYDGPTGPLIRRLDKDPTHVHKLSRRDWIDWAEARLQGVEWHGLLRYLIGSKYLHLSTRMLRRVTPAILISGFKTAP